MKIIAIVNQKGGVGKTTTAVNLAAALADRGNNVCLIDMDPQANASAYLGYDENEEVEGNTIANAILAYSNGKQFNMEDILRFNPAVRIDYIPSDVSLSSAELMLMNCMARERVLQKLLKQECFSNYDYIIIDCLPSLGILMINSLVAASDVLIPVQCQKFAYTALEQLAVTINMVKENLNDQINILGILPTMYNNTNMSKAVLEALKEGYGNLVFDTVISMLVEVVTSSYNNIPLTKIERSKVGQQYKTLAEEIFRRFHEEV